MTRTRTSKGGSEKAKSQRDLARRLKVSRSTVDRLRQDGLTCDRNGEYDLNEAKELQRIRVLRARDLADTGKAKQGDTLQLKEDRLRVDLELAQHKLAVAKGEFIPRQDVAIEWRRAAVSVKNRFLGLGREMAPHLAGKGPREIESLINQRVFEILRLLAHQDYTPELMKDPTVQPTMKEEKHVEFS
jgi:hypothetical protein